MFLSMRQEILSCPLIGWLLRCKIFELKNINIAWGATQPPALSSCHVTTKHHGKLTDARLCSKALSLRSALVRRCVVDSCQTHSGEENQPYSWSAPKPCQASSACSSPAATFPLGAGILSLFAFSIPELWKEKEEGSREQR